jgi:PAS domain S-box-containing protein
MVTVLVADDDELVRAALADLLRAEPDIKLVGVAGDVQAAARIAAGLQPDVALIDFRISGGGGSVAADEIARVSPETRLLGFSAHEERGAVVEMLGAGAVGYQVKGAASGELVEAIRRAARGQFSMSTALARATFGGIIGEVAVLKQKERAHVLAEARTRNLLEGSMSATVLIDSDGTVILANRRLLQMFGYEAEELVGASVDKLLTPRSRRDHAGRLRPTPGGGDDGMALVARMTCIRSDGSRFPVEVSSATIVTPLGVEAAIAFTERSPARPADAAHLEDDLPRRTLDSSRDAMLIVDRKGTIELANQHVERLFGYPPAEMLGKSVEMLFSTRFEAAHVEHRSRFLANPKLHPLGFGLALAGRRRDGTEFGVDISLSRVRSAGGWALAEAIRDISERRRVEEEVRQVDERFEQFVEASPDGVVLIDPEGRIKQVNARAEAQFGYDRRELVGNLVETLLADRFRNVFVGHRTRYLATTQRRPMGVGLELAGRRKDGSEFPVDISLKPLKTREGLLGVAHIRDLTESKRSERHLLLAHLVRTQEEERLRIASDIHDDTIQAITAAGMRLEMLRDQLTDDRQLETLAKVEENVHLAISRLRYLMFELRPPGLERDGLAAALRLYLEQFRADVGIQGTLDVRLSEEPAHDTGAIIYRVIQESLTNVRKHAKASTVLVRLVGGAGGFEGTVADDGIGFAINAVGPRPGHLGLAAMSERAEMAHGRLEVASTPKKGTEVRFWIPQESMGEQATLGKT